MNKNLYRLFAGGIFIAKLFDSIKRLFVNSWGTEKIENCVSGFGSRIR